MCLNSHYVYRDFLKRLHPMAIITAIVSNIVGTAIIVDKIVVDSVVPLGVAVVVPVISLIPSSPLNQYKSFTFLTGDISYG